MKSPNNVLQQTGDAIHADPDPNAHARVSPLLSVAFAEVEVPACSIE
jgi:hypothetical protein